MLVFFVNDTANTESYTYLHTLFLHDALPISLLYRPVPEDIGGESVSRRIPQQAWRDELDARKDERRKTTGAAARNAARIVHVEVTRSPMTMRPGMRNEKQKRSEEHTSELQSLMRISYAVFCLKKKKNIAQTK